MKLLRCFLDFLFPPRANEAMVAGTSLEQLGTLMEPVAIDEDTVSLLPYRRALVQAFVTEAKFKDNEKAQRLLAALLRDYLIDWTRDRGVLDGSLVILVPVPLSPERLKERGYNQAERIARFALDGVPGTELLPQLLARIRETRPQTSLDGRARRTNMQSAFMASLALDPSHTYIVFDDVTTTGSTLIAAREALHQAGASSVYGLSLAH